MTIPASPFVGSQQPKPIRTKLLSYITARRQLYYALAVAVLFLTCVFRYWMGYDPTDSVTRRGWEMARVAINLHEKGQFVDPYLALNTGPTAHLAPVFPLFMALVIQVFGAGSVGIFVLKIMGVVVVALQVALLPLFSHRLGMGSLNGFIAASIWIIAKPMIQYDWESFYAAILVAITSCVYRRYLDPKSQGSGRAWLLGALLGVLILVLPTTGSVLALWVVWEIWRRKLAFIRTSLLPLVVLPALIVSPWIIRNYLVFHHPMIRDNFGLELGVSNNDCAQFSNRLNIDSNCFFHPSVSVSEARKIAEMGEVQYNALRLREARQWIATHPKRFMELTGMRFIAFWLPTETGTIHYAGTGRRQERVIIYLITLLGIPGLWILYGRDKKSAAVSLSWLILFPLPYYITQFMFWHAYPILWLIFLLGAVPITRSISSKFDLSNSLDLSSGAAIVSKNAV